MFFQTLAIAVAARRLSEGGYRYNGLAGKGPVSDYSPRLGSFQRRHGRSASDGPQSGWLLTHNGAPGITNRETLAWTARSDHSPCAGARTKEGDIGANSNAGAGADFILTVD